MSSANNFTKKFVAFGRSLINTRNNKGPKIEPWGTPKRILSKDLSYVKRKSYSFIFVSKSIFSFIAGYLL